MAVCRDCKQEMTKADTCTWTHIQFDDDVYPRDTYHFGEPSGRCNDCGIKHGGIHHFGCDVERCPRCHMQLIGCECVVSTEVLLVKYDKKKG
jgi:hypothetical protein